MNFISLSKRMKIPAFRELVIISVITFILIVLAITKNKTKVISDYLYKHHNSLIDNIFIPLVITSVLWIIYSFRRNSENIQFISRLQDSEGSLNNANAQLEVLMELNSAMLFKTKADADFTMIYISPNVEDILGYSHKDYFKKGFWAAKIHHEDAQKISGELTEICKTGAGKIQYRFINSAGEWRWMQAEIKCLYNEKGNPAELIGNWSDINDIKLKELTLQTTYDQLELLMQSSSAVLFRTKTDDSFTLIDTTENVQRVLGYLKEEMFEKNFWVNNMHPEDATAVFKELPVVFETGFFACEFRFKHKDGSWRWMRSETKCLFDEEGKPYELVGNWWDITEQKQNQENLKEANERFELVSKATRDIVFDWNIVTNAVWASNEIFKSFGYTKETYRADLSWWKEKVHPDDQESVMNELIDGIKQKTESISRTYRFRKADGSYANVFSRGYIVYDKNEQPVRWIGSINDITVLKKTECELKKALIKSEESAKAKSEFLANMSHEIRTPLNGIVGMTDLALDTDLTAEQRRYLDTVKLSCDSLLTLINDILDFSKIEAGKLDISPVNFSLRDEIPGFLSPLALKASLKKLEMVFYLESNVPDSLFADMHRFQQIISNLVSNAIKFTERGEVVIKAQLESADEDEAVLLFSVTDTGIGIPTDKLESVFEDFTQADGSTTRKYGGTGLGLAITKRLVTMMGGKIWAESTENKGSAFHFTIKVKLQANHTARRFIPLPVLDNTPVLVVEDNYSTSNCITKILENFNMKPVAVNNGENAIVELKRAAHLRKPYRIVLMDITLAGKMDGFEVAECITQDEDLADTNIIVISMSQQVSDRERFARLGVHQYFSKPFSQSDLLDSIQNTLSLSDKNIYKTLQNNTHKSMSLMSHNTNTYKILLAEDNLVNQEVAASMLNKKGHTVVIANNGAEAAALYNTEAFDLVLMDVQMPMLNGYEATARIRDIENVTGNYTPVIGLTANAMKGDREKCLEAGMDDYVSKPIKLNDMFAAIDRIKEKINKDNIMEKLPAESKPLVNLETILENLDWDYEVLESILEKFDSTVIAYMTSIETNAKKGSVSEISSLAHTLKGQCMIVEMERVVKLAEQIETLAMKNALAEINQLVPALKSELQKGLKALKEARVKISEAETV